MFSMDTKLVRIFFLSLFFFILKKKKKQISLLNVRHEDFQLTKAKAIVVN